MGIDVTAELGEDGEPDVFGAEDEVVVLVVGVDGGFDEAAGGGGVEGGCFGGGEVGSVGGVEDSFAFEGFFEVGCGEEGWYGRVRFEGWLGGACAC